MLKGNEEGKKFYCETVGASTGALEAVDCRGDFLPPTMPLLGKGRLRSGSWVWTA